ncbi:hypothetical protein [Chryseobacterium polytrichastri]|uniref:Uncharacterized protein n=1 Tax=Chryseobacterium polytrichastri TaxID=1302687 RepID=A0A1M7L7G6_9FLAO|nr:hypothetical protein [Chryseobacterium polytrichastri]SHM73765.1 hypothetical protein SAMN05444267_10865 [Chryseobacterium polytrichastri]
MRFQKDLSDLLATEIEEFYGVSLNLEIESKEIVYMLYKSHFGILVKRIHISLLSGMVINYNIATSFLGIRII